MLTKEKIRKTIDTMPEILSLDEVIEKLILLEKIEEGMKDADEGRVYTTEEVKRRLNGWLK
jgi:predicted transcriptional regulator